MLLCVFLGLTNQVCNYFEFLCKTYFVFENLKGECLKILILGKLGFFRFIQSIFRSIEIAFKIVCEPLSVSINRNWFLINQNSRISFLKNQIWLVQTNFFKTFQNFFSLSDSARLDRDFFCHFPPNFLQGFLSLSRYVFFTLPFALFFSFSCIIPWFLGKFSNYA